MSSVPRRCTAFLRSLPRNARVGVLGTTWTQIARAADADRNKGRIPEPRRVRAKPGALPLVRECLDAACAIGGYERVPVAELPAGLAQLHGALAVGAPVLLTLRCARSRELLEGAGFDQVRVSGDTGSRRRWIRARRARTLPDYVGPQLRVLVCGLNPSPFAAASGVPFGRPGNRFWPAARLAGLVDRDRDPLYALQRGVGFTDLCKRTTRRASDLSAAEYAHGLERLESLVRALRPRVLCFVGLDGWRRVVDAGARPGWIPAGCAGRPAYLMPSTSGLNAHIDVEKLSQHLKRVLEAGPLHTEA